MVAPLPVDFPESAKEGAITYLCADHMEEHGTFAVADNPGGRINTTAESGKREIGIRCYERREIGEQLHPVFTTLRGRTSLFQQIVGQIGGQPFRPVSFTQVDIDRVTPPGMGYLVRKTGVDDKREPDDRATEQSE